MLKVNVDIQAMGSDERFWHLWNRDPSTRSRAGAVIGWLIEHGQHEAARVSADGAAIVADIAAADIGGGSLPYESLVAIIATLAAYEAARADSLARQYRL